MVANSRLILYGNSVFLAGIKAQLEHISALELVTMEAMPTNMAVWARACRPQAVLFDLAMGYTDFAVALLHDLPGLLLIGVDANSNELLVLSGQQERAVALADLLKVIRPWETEEMGEAEMGREGDTETQG